MQRRLIKMWADDSAAHKYYLQEYKPYGWFLKFLEGERGIWLFTGDEGSEHWATQISRHYGIPMPTEVTEEENCFL